MFFFQNYTLLNIAGAVIVVAGLLLCNEITRRNQYAAVAVFVVVPVLLSIFWWPYAKTESSADWFGWVKTYSALAGVIGFMAIRYFKKVGESKFAFIFPGFILAFNILEAIFKDFQVFQNAPNAQTLSGPWNILNAIAGVFLILTITGWMGIKVSNTKLSPNSAKPGSLSPLSKYGFKVLKSPKEPITKLPPLGALGLA